MRKGYSEFDKRISDWIDLYIASRQKTNQFARVRFYENLPDRKIFYQILRIFQQYYPVKCQSVKSVKRNERPRKTVTIFVSQNRKESRMVKRTKNPEEE